jgi:parvulin-like peptidyl-prolyl isomerase
MPKTSRTILIALSIAIAACAGKPAIPDETQERDYASTRETADNPGEAELTPISEGADQASLAPVAKGPVATVNGEPVDADTFNGEITRGVEKGVPPGLLRQLSSQIVDQLVDRVLIEAAIAKSKVVVKAEEIDAKLEEVRAEFAKSAEMTGQETTLESLTAQLGITEEEFRSSIEQAIAIEKMLEERGLKEPDAKAARSFYDDNKSQFERPEQVRIRQIMISVDKENDAAAWDAAEKQAASMHAEAIKPKADFAALAKEKSQGQFASRGGDIGFRKRGMMPAELEEAAFALKPGEIAKPVKTAFGWHVIKLEEHVPGGLVPFEEIEKELRASMKNEVVNAELMKLLSDLRDGAKIELHPDNIE